MWWSKRPDPGPGDEPDAHLLEYYAPGVGNVRVGWAGALEQEEVLELVEVSTLGREELAALRATILAMETRAHELSADVYGTTAPAQPPG